MSKLSDEEICCLRKAVKEHYGEEICGEINKVEFLGKNGECMVYFHAEEQPQKVKTEIEKHEYILKIWEKNGSIEEMKFETLTAAMNAFCTEQKIYSRLELLEDGKTLQIYERGKQ